MKKTNAKNSRLTMWLLALGIMAFVPNENVAAQQLHVVKDPKLGSVLSQSKKILGRPKSLTPAQKIQIAQKILDGQGQKVSSVNSVITLSVKNMMSVNNQASLGLTRPQSVSPTLATFSGSEGNLFVAFTAPSAGKYLIDLSITAGSETKFKLVGNGNILTTTGAFANLSFVMDAMKANEVISFKLSGDLHWLFHSLEISQIK